MNWNKDITSIPYGDEVLLKVKYKNVHYYTFHLCEKHGRMGEDDHFILTDDTNNEDLTTDVEIISWLALDEEIENG